MEQLMSSSEQELRKQQRQFEKNKILNDYKEFSEKISQNDLNNRKNPFTSSMWEKELQSFFGDQVNASRTDLINTLNRCIGQFGAFIKNKDNRNEYNKIIKKYCFDNIKTLVYVTIVTAIDTIVKYKIKEEKTTLQFCVGSIAKCFFKQTNLISRLDKFYMKLANETAEKIDSHKSNMQRDVYHLANYFMDHIASSADVIKIYKAQDDKNKDKYMHCVELGDSVIRCYNHIFARDKLFKAQNYPMICKPKHWSKSIIGGGYLLNETDPLVSVKSPRHLDKIKKDIKNRHLSSNFLKSANLLQDVPWRINDKVLHVLDKVLSCRDDRKNEQSLAVLNAQTLDLANEFRDKVFYLPWYLDFRGRMYPSVLQLSPQAHDPGRALLLFAKPQEIRRSDEDSTLEHLAIYGYNKYQPSANKVSKEKMIAWIEEHEVDIFNSSADPLKNTDFWNNASDKYTFLAFCFEWSSIKQSCQYNRATNLPVYIDGTCNGFQHYAALLRDDVVSPHVNLVDGECPGDLYNIIALKVREKAASSETLTNEDKHFVDTLVDRNFIKKSVISASYGAGVDRRTEVMTKKLKDLSDCSSSKDCTEEERRLFAGVTTENLKDKASKIETTITYAINRLCPSLSKVRSWLNKVARAVVEKGECLSWISPAGFPVHNFYFNHPTYEIRLFVNGKSRKILFRKFEEIDRQLLDKEEQFSSIAPNYIHSLDSAHASNVIVNFSERVSTADAGCIASVHDCFATYATSASLLHDVIRKEFYKIHSKNQLSVFKKQVEERFSIKLPNIPVLGSFDLSQVMNSRYFFY